MTVKSFDLVNLSAPDFRALASQCTGCGLCLRACPTYEIFGTEMAAPRGRLVLMQQASNGLGAAPGFAETLGRHLDLCLACRACEATCAAGVRYGTLVSRARAALLRLRPMRLGERLLRWIALKELLPHRGRLRWLARLLWLYQVSGIQRLVRASRLLPERLATLERLLPRLSPHFRYGSAPAPALGQKLGQVALFFGCVQDAFLSPVNEATVHVLQRNGYEVHFPPGQTCCGAAPLHLGDTEVARQLARRNIDAFLAGPWSTVICNAGGCGATLKEEYVQLFAGDPEYCEKAERFSAMVQDVSEFLAPRLVNPPAGRLSTRATYADSCHLRHGQRVVEQPRALLRSVPGLELVELARPDRCCGSAGVFNIVHPDVAEGVLAAKLADIRATGAQLVVTSNAGCHLQLAAGLRRSTMPSVEVKHVVQVLEDAYEAGETSRHTGSTGATA